MKRPAKKKKTTYGKKQSFLSEDMTLNKIEITCIARHLLVQRRQETFNLISRPLEACGNCKYYDYCGSHLEKSRMCDAIYTKITEQAGMRGSFMIGVFPLVPHEI